MNSKEKRLFTNNFFIFKYLRKIPNFNDFENSLPNHNKILANLPDKPEKISRKEKILKKVLIYNDIKKEKIEKNKSEDELKKKLSSNKSNPNLSAEKYVKMNKHIIFQRSFNNCNFSNSNTFSFIRPKTSSAHKSSFSLEIFKNSNFSSQTCYTNKVELIERPKKTENKFNRIFSESKKKCYSFTFIV